MYILLLNTDIDYLDYLDEDLNYDWLEEPVSNSSSNSFENNTIHGFPAAMFT